ncbi:hypothetical protein B0A48_08712 [Cryoendolithus antarcticus]|uniref:Uncharacterized protein n=1 Tax=Cryoendolithus antarcticus TaxID=1507870 RepID=A0A1V8T489_9PEZI|nr:hypothetical protein B0A48_08712 [Cryoendolithus antarcticus]
MAQNAPHARYQYVPPYDYSSYIASSRANTLPPLQTDPHPPPSPTRQHERAASIPSLAPWTSPYDVSPIMSRSPSVAGSDRFSAVSGITGYWPQNPLHVHPAAAYVAELGAAQVVSEYRGTHKETVSSDDDDSNANRDDVQFGEPALELINSFLDNLLYSILASARSTSLFALRPAVTDVLKSRLAKEAISSADEELQELLAGGEEEDDKAQTTPKENARKWDLELVWKRTRLRVMVYMRLGEMEDDDEEKYVKEQELFSGRELDSRRFSANSGLVSWSAAIFLTSVLEYVAEQTLQISGSAAYARARRQSRTALKALQSQDRVLVEEYDVERVALDSRVGRLWRTWRKTLRSNNTRPTTPTQRGMMRSRRNSYRDGIAAALGRQDEHMSSGEENGVPAVPRGFSPVDVPEMEHPEHVIASNIPLPMGNARRDVDEIEVPGLARDPDRSSEEDDIPIESKALRRNSFTHPMLPGMVNGLPTPANSTSPASPAPTKLPFFKPLLQRQRSISVPTPLRTPMLEIPGAFPTFPDEDEEKVAPVAVDDDAKSPLEKVPEVDDTLGPDHKPEDVKVLLDKVAGGAPAEPETEEQKAKGRNHGLIAAGVAGATALAGVATAAVLGKRDEDDVDKSRAEPETAAVERSLSPARVRSAEEIEELDKRKSMMDIKAVIAEQEGRSSRSGSLAPASAAEVQRPAHANGIAAPHESERKLSSASSNKSFTLGEPRGDKSLAAPGPHAVDSGARETQPNTGTNPHDAALGTAALESRAETPQDASAFAQFAEGASRLRGITALNTEQPESQSDTPSRASRRDAPLYMPAPASIVNKHVEQPAYASSLISQSGTTTPQRVQPGSGNATPISEKPRDERDFLPSRSRRNSLERRATLDADKMRPLVIPQTPNGEQREGYMTRSRRASLERRATLDEGKMRGLGMSPNESTRAAPPQQKVDATPLPAAGSGIVSTGESGSEAPTESLVAVGASNEMTAPQTSLLTPMPLAPQKQETSDIPASQLLSTPMKSGAAAAMSGAVTPPAITSASIRGPEDFDALVQGADTAKYTLTPETVRDVPTAVVSQPPAELRPVENKRVSMVANGIAPQAVESTPTQLSEAPSGPAEALRKLEQPQEDDRRASRSQTSKQATSAQVPTNKTAGRELTTEEKIARRRSTSKPPPRNTSEHRRSGLIAREPQVVTESIRDFADFIRSTGPDKEPTLYQITTNNRSTTSLHSLRSTVGSTRERSQSIGAMSLSNDKDVGRTKSLTQKDMIHNNIPPVPPMPAGSTRPSREARGATGVSSSNNDLINFLRDGPDGKNGDHRISRTVAPFRNTMDSDQLREDFHTGHAGYSTLNTAVGNVNGDGPKSAGSVKSPAVSYGSAPPPPAAKMNGAGSYATPAAAHPAHSGQPSRLSEGNLLAAPGKPPGGDFEKKRYRNKDPYAIDMDSDEDNDDLLTALPPTRGRQEESLADFLRNTEPPSDNAPKPIVANAAAGRAASLTSANSSAVPLLDPDRTRSLQTPYSASITSTSTASKPRGPKLEAREPVTKPSNVPKSTTSDLAEFFRTSEPPAGSAPAPVVGRSGGRGSAAAVGRGSGEKEVKQKKGMWGGVMAFAKGLGRKGSSDGSAREGQGVKWGGRK